MLWWRVVGVTDRIIHSKTDDEEKNLEIESCNKEVFRLVPDQPGGFAEQFNEEGGMADIIDDDDLFKKVQTSNKNKEVGHIKAEPELSLTLLRHWTLFDSL
jgi:hypothetical protein